MTENRETFIYDVILKRHDGCSRSDVCIYYDEDKTNALNEMAKYVNKNGFSITEKDGRFSIVFHRRCDSEEKEAYRRNHRRNIVL